LKRQILTKYCRHYVHKYFNEAHQLLISQIANKMDGWLGFNGILRTQVAAISCL